jgi:hypothetical protein
MVLTQQHAQEAVAAWEFANAVAFVFGDAAPEELPNFLVRAQHTHRRIGRVYLLTSDVYNLLEDSLKR